MNCKKAYSLVLTKHLCTGKVDSDCDHVFMSYADAYSYIEKYFSAAEYHQQIDGDFLCDWWQLDNLTIKIKPIKLIGNRSDFIHAAGGILCNECEYNDKKHYEDEGEPEYVKNTCLWSKYSHQLNDFCSFGNCIIPNKYSS